MTKTPGMKNRAVFIIAGSAVLFVAVLAPAFTLIAWLSSNTVWPFLLAAALLSVPALYSFWFTLNNSNNMTLRWLWMQTLGLGTVLMSLVVLASIFTAQVSSHNVGQFVLIAWFILSVLAIWQATNIKSRYLEFPATQSPKPVRIVQISDVHVGSRSAAFLRKVVVQVNQHNPDIVVITGDLLDASTVSTDDLAALGHLKCPAYMCIGNHERYVDLDAALESIATHGVTILRDEALTIDGVQLIGIDDRDRPDALPSILDSMHIDPTMYSVLLYHRPDGWQAALDKNIKLTLAGHTHAGQIFPFGFLVKRQYPNMAGLFTKKGNSLYVSMGTGTWGPVFRLGTRCEMTVIDLHNDDKKMMIKR